MNNKVMRGFVMSGLAVAAGLAVGAGPAAASSAAPSASSASSASSSEAKAPAKMRSRILGFYRSPGACHQDGRRGEFRRQWTGHDCIPTRQGFRRGWALKVYYGWGGDGPRGPHGPGPGGHGPDHGPHGPGPDHGHGPWKKN